MWCTVSYARDANINKNKSLLLKNLKLAWFKVVVVGAEIKAVLFLSKLMYKLIWIILDVTESLYIGQASHRSGY